MSSSNAHRPRRSCLYMPGANPRALEKAKTLSADTVILDLEDAVAPDAKLEARNTVCAAVKAGGYGPREVVIRINGPETEWGADDMAAAVAAGPDAILVPKVVSGKNIEALSDAMTKAGAPDDMALWVMIEMPRAILNIEEIADAAANTRLAAFVMGTNDLAKELRAVATPDRAAFQTALSLTMTAARTGNIIAIDGVYNDIKDLEGLEDECQQGRTLGFDGKTLIHPAQLDICNRIFAPAAADVEQAQAVIAAFSDPENAGKGVLKVNGRMTEILHLEEAHRTVATAESIAGFENSGDPQ